MSDTKNKHIGNVLSNASDKSVKEILEQYAKKSGINIYSDDWKEKLLTRLREVLMAEEYNHEDNIL